MGLASTVLYESEFVSVVGLASIVSFGAVWASTAWVCLQGAGELAELELV